MDFHQSVLSVPWTLSERELKRCRREATRSGEAEARGRRRGKRGAVDAPVTGLEKTAVLKAKGVALTADVGRLPRVRLTGLERAAKRGASVGIGLESSSRPKTRSSSPALDEGRSQKARVTGLERTTKCLRPVSSSSSSTLPTMTITSTMDCADSSQRTSTGLERKAKPRTGSASPIYDSRAPIKARITGLERGLQPTIASNRGLPGYSEPSARSARTKVTGLEKKPKRVKTLHVEEKYDALGL